MERARLTIESRALHRLVAEVEDGDTWVCRPHAPGEIGAALRGRELSTVHRLGKSMWVETGGGPSLGLHLGMTGAILIDEEPHPGVWDRFALRFEDGGRLALRDRRRLGRAVLAPDLSGLGPDAGEIGREEFRRRVGRGRAPLKARLMDQGVLAGVGNLLADEALWRAGLHPRRAAGEVSDEESDRLRRALRGAIRDAIRKGGAHTGRLVAHRAPGEACPACGTALERATVGGRTTWWCPAEQR